MSIDFKRSDVVRTVRDKMRFWSELQTTDPKYTKGFRRAGGFSGTDINPAWRDKRFTEAFGPCGEGWGWKIVKHWTETVEVTGQNSTFKKYYAFVMLDLWWRNEDGEKCWTGPQIGGTEYGRSPDEAYKMSITDAKGKIQLSLGLSSDVYMGIWDDSKYQAEAALTTAIREWSMSIDEVRKEANNVKSTEDLEELKSEVYRTSPPEQLYAELRSIFADRLHELTEETP
jgi:hypothetical protein